MRPIPAAIKGNRGGLITYLARRRSDVDDELTPVVAQVVVVDAEIQPSAHWRRKHAAPADENGTVVIDASNQTAGELIEHRRIRRTAVRRRAGRKGHVL